MKKMKLVALALCAPLILASCGNDTRAQVMAKAETYTLEKAAEKYGTGKHKTVTKFTVVKGEEAKVKALAISIPVPVIDSEAEIDVVINPLVLVGKDKLEEYEADVKEESKKSETDYAVPSYTYADDKVTFQATYSKTLSEKKVSGSPDRPFHGTGHDMRRTAGSGSASADSAEMPPLAFTVHNYTGTIIMRNYNGVDEITIPEEVLNAKDAAEEAQTGQSGADLLTP